MFTENLRIPCFGIGLIALALVGCSESSPLASSPQEESVTLLGSPYTNPTLPTKPPRPPVKFESYTIFDGYGNRYSSFTFFDTINIDFFHNEIAPSGEEILGRIDSVDGNRYSDICLTSSCLFDSRTVFFLGNQNWESITTKTGRYYNFIDFQKPSDPGLYTGYLSNVARYKDYDEPCEGKTYGQCTFDSRAIFYLNGNQWESITTPSGKFYNFINEQRAPAGVYTGYLKDVPRYASGPCQNRWPCRFQARTIVEGNNNNPTPDEVVIAYDRLYVYTFPPSHPNGKLRFQTTLSFNNIPTLSQMGF